MGFFLSKVPAKGSAVLDLLGSAILAAGGTVAILYLFKVIIEVSQNSVVF